MNRKIGTTKNLILRVLCLNSNIPAQAPNGPKKAINKSLDSGILPLPLLLFSLSIPKIVRAMLFTITNRRGRKKS